MNPETPDSDKRHQRRSALRRIDRLIDGLTLVTPIRSLVTTSGIGAIAKLWEAKFSMNITYKSHRKPPPHKGRLMFPPTPSPAPARRGACPTITGRYRNIRDRFDGVV
ncbi:hypothetical protein EVAR_9990_1 [Eumeta japonica]|uniref:Uncharacterized protein n=1 Tax=Eumeta variegata TaxID=151549 RepID=A0A4C1TR08_EUMVA|nr:hypothetical protein EVAR_9990_1 [Eumeta japonica]